MSKINISYNSNLINSPYHQWLHNYVVVYWPQDILTTQVRSLVYFRPKKAILVDSDGHFNETVIYLKYPSKFNWCHLINFTGL